MRIRIAPLRLNQGRQLIDRGSGLRHVGDAEPQHGGIAEPECQSGDKADFRDFDGADAPGRIDAVAHRAAGEDAGAHIVTDRIAGETGERRHPIGHVRPADRAQREQIVERQREIAAGDAQRGQRDVAPFGRHQRLDHLVDLDVAQDAIEHDRRDRDDGDAQEEADAVPANRPVADPRRRVQRLEHAGLTIG